MRQINVPRYILCQFERKRPPFNFQNFLDFQGWRTSLSLSHLLRKFPYFLPRSLAASEVKSYRSLPACCSADPFLSFCPRNIYTTSCIPTISTACLLHAWSTPVTRDPVSHHHPSLASSERLQCPACSQTTPIQELVNKSQGENKAYRIVYVSFNPNP